MSTTPSRVRAGLACAWLLAAWFLASACSPEVPLVIGEIDVQPQIVVTGQTVVLTVDASGPPGLAFEWALLAGEGRLAPSRSTSVQYTAPDTPGSATVQLVVTHDGRQEVLTKDLTIVEPTPPVRPTPTATATPTSTPTATATPTPTPTTTPTATTTPTTTPTPTITPTPTSTPTPTPTPLPQVRILSPSVRVRAGPDVETCPVVSGAQIDETYAVTGRARDAAGETWYRICCPGGVAGWVHGDLVSSPDPQAKIPWVQAGVCPAAIADFDLCDRSAYLDVHGVDWPEGTVNRVTERYVAEPGRGCVAELAYEVVDWASFWIDLQHADLSRHAALVFDARVDEPLAESLWLKVELKRADGREIGFVWVEKYRLLTMWSEIRIPFADFQSIDYPGLRPLPPPQEWTQMEELVLTVELVVPEGAERELQELILYLDNIQVE